MAEPLVPDFVRQTLESLSISASEEELELLARYLDLLLETNQRFNLTAIRDRDQAWQRHILDSLTLLPFVEDIGAEGPIPSHAGEAGKGAIEGNPTAQAAVIDIGSGGGLPGIPLAITRPDLRITLLEATGKKARFLELCAADLKLANVRVIQNRAETLGRNRAHRERYDLAICRAIGPMSELLEYAMPLVRVEGLVLAMKGPKAQEELEQASNALHLLGAGEVQVYEAYPPGFEVQTVIVAVTKQSVTPRIYPRLPGTPHREPL